LNIWIRNSKFTVSQSIYQFVKENNFRLFGKGKGWFLLWDIEGFLEFVKIMTYEASHYTNIRKNPIIIHEFWRCFSNFGWNL